MKKIIAMFPAALSALLALLTFILLLLFPAEASAGGRKGLQICFDLIIPSLFPFFVISSLLSNLGISKLISRAAEKPMERIFALPGSASVPLILGLTGGYPVGASAVASLVSEGIIDKRQGEKLLPFCNNTGPAFIIGAAGTGIFGSSGTGILLYASHIAAALATGIIFSAAYRKDESHIDRPVYELKSLAQVLPVCIRGALASILNVCAYVVFFSVLTGLLDATGVFSSAAGILAVSTGFDLHFCRSLLTGILELGSGIASMRGLDANPVNIALASFILGFGSLSVHCQTAAAVSSANIRCARHFAGRITHGIISAIISFALFTLLRS